MLRFILFTMDVLMYVNVLFASLFVLYITFFQQMLIEYQNEILAYGAISWVGLAFLIGLFYFGFEVFVEAINYRKQRR